MVINNKWLKTDRKLKKRINWTVCAKNRRESKTKGKIVKSKKKLN